MTEPVRFGRYAVKRVLGRGTVGVVYQGRDPEGGRDVVITVLKPPSGATPAEVQAAQGRLEQAVRAAARLSHPGLVPVLEVGSEGDGVFVATEPVAGQSLAERLSSGDELTAEQVVEMVEQIGSALDHAHEDGVVHGEVSPTSIVLARDGRYLLADLGLSVGASAGDDAGQVAAPQFSSPEHALGEPLTPASDQFSLGALAYRVLTGEAPFHGESPTTVLYQVTHVDPPSPSLVNPRVSPEVGRVVLRALEKRARHRYPTCHALGVAMRAALSGTPLEEQDVMGAPAGEDAGPPSDDAWTDIPLHGGGDDVGAVDRSVSYHTAPQPSRPHRAGATLGMLATAVSGLVVAGLAVWGVWTYGPFGPVMVNTTVTVDSEPPEQALAIWLNDRPLGLTTPAEIQLEGEQGMEMRLTLVRDDDVVASTEVRLGGDVPSEWVPEVEVPIVAVRYEVRSEPTGALVRLDGQVIARPTPVEVDLFPGQSYELVVEREGYHPATRTVDPAELEPEISSLDFLLDRVILPGRVRASADVPITIVVTSSDGGPERRAEGLEPSLEIPPGRYEVTLSAPEIYFVGTADVTVAEDEDVVLPDVPEVARVLIFDAPGNASVQIDDFEPFPSGGPHTVSVGPHRIVFEWPSGEQVVREVDIRTDGQEISARHP